MRRSPLPFIISLIIVIAIGSLLKFYFFPQTAVGYNPFISAQSWLTAKFSGVHIYFTTLIKINSLVKENQKLLEENQRLSQFAASIDVLQDENDFLKKTLKVSKDSKRTSIPAGVADMILMPNGYQLTINKGQGDGVKTGDIIISTEGILIGQIKEIYSNYSTATFVRDLQFKINSKVLGGQTSGIVRGALKDGMKLELVVQEDEISEGDIIISNGSDSFPAGLVIGTVKHVESVSNELFKQVSIAPAVDQVNLSQVVVLEN